MRSASNVMRCQVMRVLYGFVSFYTKRAPPCSANDWNRQKTADQLQVNRTTLYKKIKQYDLEEYGRTV